MINCEKTKPSTSKNEQFTRNLLPETSEVEKILKQKLNESQKLAAALQKQNETLTSELNTSKAKFQQLQDAKSFEI